MSPVQKDVLLFDHMIHKVDVLAQDDRSPDGQPLELCLYRDAFSRPRWKTAGIWTENLDQVIRFALEAGKSVRVYGEGRTSVLYSTEELKAFLSLLPTLQLVSQHFQKEITKDTLISHLTSRNLYALSFNSGNTGTERLVVHRRLWAWRRATAVFLTYEHAAMYATARALNASPVACTLKDILSQLPDQPVMLEPGQQYCVVIPRDYRLQANRARKRTYLGNGGH